MCGIFGYSGLDNATNEVIEGLKRLEYRGYDSFGIATIVNNSINIYKKVGAIADSNINLNIQSNIAIGHTRWATHGGVVEKNSHPHYSSNKDFVLAQNGIVENYQDLKSSLKTKSYKFITETDTEVIVRLIEEKQKEENDLLQGVRKAFLELKGRNTIILLDKNKNRIIAVKNGSPLVVGIGKDEYYFASDTLSFANKTNKVIILQDFEMVEYLKDSGQLKIFNVKTEKEIKHKIETLNQKNIEISKEGYNHFMLKEIVEQKETIKNAIQYSKNDLKEFINQIKKSRTIYLTGAGTAYFAASQIAYLLRTIAKVNAIEIKSYEIDAYKNIFTNQDLLIAISQSGETADTLEAVKIAQKTNLKIASLVNMLGSTLTRISEFQFFTRSGPEICVASTKAFTAQCAWGYLVAKTIVNEHESAKKNIEKFSTNLNNYFSKKTFTYFRKLVKDFVGIEHFFVLGKGQNFNIALEGSLKIKEITYKHFEGFAAGELKHGVIALIEKNTPVFVIISKDSDKEYMIGAAAEVKSRGAKVYGLSDEENDLFTKQIIKPKANKEIDFLAQVLPFQLISYFLGVELGNSPDKPRNLAKSVTVK